MEDRDDGDRESGDGCDLILLLSRPGMGADPNRVIAVCHCHSQAARQDSVARQGRHSRGFKETELAGMRTVPPPYPTHPPEISGRWERPRS